VAPPISPRAVWPQHPRYPAQTLLLESHEAFRRHSAWIIDAIEFVAPRREPSARKRLRWLARHSTEFDWWMSGLAGHERYE
jgi:hypothetical protein